MTQDQETGRKWQNGVAEMLDVTGLRRGENGNGVGQFSLPPSEPGQESYDITGKHEAVDTPAGQQQQQRQPAAEGSPHPHRGPATAYPYAC